MSKRRHLSASIILALLALLPEAAGAQTLQDALSSAYNTNPQLQAERATLRATDENVPQALANWRPTVSISGSQGIDHNSQHQDCTKLSLGANPCTGLTAQEASELGALGNSPNVLNSTSNLSPQTEALTISQPIYRGGRTEARAAVRRDRLHECRARPGDARPQYQQ